MKLRKSVKDRALLGALKPWALGVLGLLACSMGTAAFAQEGSLYPSFSFDLNYGLTTMKSKLVESNDTGSALGYSLGGFAGSDKNIEFNLGFEKDESTFALNDSKISYDWQDTKIRYHYGYFYAGVVFSRLNLMVTSAGADIIDAAGSGYGGSLGFYSPVGRGGSLRVDVTRVSIAAMKNSIATDVSVPSRIDIDIGAAIDIWGKWLDFTFGYRMRMLSVQTESVYAETESSTYLGLRMSTTR